MKTVVTSIYRKTIKMFLSNLNLKLLYKFKLNRKQCALTI